MIGMHLPRYYQKIGILLAHTVTIGRDNSNTRHNLGRFNRRTKIVSKSQNMVDISLWRHLQEPLVFDKFRNIFLSSMYRK